MENIKYRESASHKWQVVRRKESHSAKSREHRAWSIEHRARSTRGEKLERRAHSGKASKQGARKKSKISIAN